MMVDVETVRALALALPEAHEQDHWGQPSFCLNKKIFATLRPDERRAMLKLTIEDQEAFTTLDPDIFAKVPGWWGDHGSTFVQLDLIQPEDFQAALEAAWLRIAPKRLIAQHKRNSPPQ